MTLKGDWLQSVNPLLGIWKSDKKQTYAELAKNLRSDHPKLTEYLAHRFHLYIRYAPRFVHYTYRGEQVRAAYKILARSGDSILSEVETTWINDQPLWHTRFVSPSCYWVTVALDEGFIYREYFARINPPTASIPKPASTQLGNHKTVGRRQKGSGLGQG